MGDKDPKLVEKSLPGGAEWMMKCAEKHQPLRFNQHPNWKIQEFVY